MAEYISREAMLKRLNDFNEWCRDGRLQGSLFAVDVIKDIPADDCQPVKHGKWKHVAGMNSKCSVCSHYFPVTEFDSRPFDINYCPNCGARMDGDAE